MSSDLGTISITSSKTSQATPGSYPCPLSLSLSLSRYDIIYFTKLSNTTTTRQATSSRTSMQNAAKALYYKLLLKINRISS
ncbi:hypothetical protein Bca101_085583 [Brassica carinata]